MKYESDAKKGKQKTSEVIVKKEKAKKVENKINEIVEKPVKASKQTSNPGKKDKKKPGDEKQQKIKGAGMKLPDNFVSIRHNESDDDGSDDDDDASVNFDSDEFEKAQEFDEEFDSGAENSSSEDEEGSNGEDDDDDEKNWLVN